MFTTVFVFGSNLAGRHGLGAALEAKQNWGAEYGVGVGRTGNSYAIPTKDENLNVLSFPQIREHINTFIQYAKDNPQCLFYMTAIGTGLAGYDIEEVKKPFTPYRKLPYNIVFTKDWL